MTTSKLLSRNTRGRGDEWERGRRLSNVSFRYNGHEPVREDISRVLHLELEAISTPPELDPIPSPDPAPEEPDPEPIPSPDPAPEPDPEPIPSPDPEPDLVPEINPDSVPILKRELV